ncbi:PREDICTED: alpha-tectorin-like [Amphimedon queenslandica]|uniref:EGF-like domain-containing protein n=1 Tax=Amphimedon queenslandica TaxID=400682 RepID=A0AAN0JAL1_AMPQE|nr:PREDICTED: alpha-tectorin-like [Amphimedon queenslandica]|eukprot:XP_019853771.1 PREDICTED: alpha-tectorin-like [Amphimedon queenslandica]
MFFFIFRVVCFLQLIISIVFSQPGCSICQMSPCQNGGTCNCTLDSAPSNYTCDCTGTGYQGINCTVAQLPFIHPPSYNLLMNQDDDCANVTLPTSVQIGPFYYKIAYVCSNGLVSFNTSYASYTPELFPLSVEFPPVIAPYWDDIVLVGSRELRYQVISGSSSIATQVNNFLTSYTGKPFNLDWLLWAYWYNVCPYTDDSCLTHQSNFFQLV